MKYGLIAERVGHSYSAEIHEMIGSCGYELKELKRCDLDAFMRAREFCGINVTIPYKTDVIPYLDVIDPLAEKIGAVNTVVNKGGKLYGYNTDYNGLRALLLRSGVRFEGQKALILGSGGTAKTANAVLRDLGVRQTVTVRRDERDGAVAYETAYTRHADAAVLLNATPCGMFPHCSEMPFDASGAPVELARFPSLQYVCDVVYNPLRTRLVLEARKRKIRAEGGLYMLVSQAVSASERFTDRSCEDGLTAEIFRKIRQNKENVVLIGMPGCGKSTVGRIAGETLGKTFVDTDDLIAERAGTSVPDVIRTKGEGYFRDLESAVVAELSAKTGMVVATGGGAVLRDENVLALKQNGVLIFIDRPLQTLKPTPDRPLADDEGKMKALYDTRAPIYKAAADIVIGAPDGAPEDTARKVCRAFKEFTDEE